MDDLLGFDRFGQHLLWQCSGRVEGDVDEIEPRNSKLGRYNNRWYLSHADDTIIVVGDATRDLVAVDGGLARQPAPHGFVSYLSANLARQIGVLSREFVTASEVVGSTASKHANRPAVDVELLNGEFQVTLGVDAETGVWTYLRTSGFTITVSELAVGRAMGKPSSVFTLLDLVPDVDLTRRLRVTQWLLPVIHALQEASRLTADVLYEDEETDEFRIVLLDSSNQPQALVERYHAGSPPKPAIFPGVQHRWETDEWSYHVDTSDPDHLWSKPIVKALESL